MNAHVPFQATGASLTDEGAQARQFTRVSEAMNSWSQVIPSAPSETTILFPILHHHAIHVAQAASTTEIFLTGGLRVEWLILDHIGSSWHKYRLLGNRVWSLYGGSPGFRVALQLAAKHGGAFSWKRPQRKSEKSDVNNPRSVDDQWAKSIGTELADIVGERSNIRNYPKWAIRILEKDIVRVRSAIAHEFSKETPSVVVLFNGRFLLDKVIQDAAAKHGIAVLFIESGASARHVDLYQHSTHDRHALERRVAENLPAVTRDSQIRSVGLAWFEDRLEGSGNSKCLVQGEKRPVVTFFSSSVNEFDLVEDSDLKGYMTQERVVQHLARICQDLDMEFRIRTHPGMRHASRRERTRWNRLIRSLPKTRVLSGGGTAKSYELLHHSDVVVTYGSTIGAEAIFIGKPVISTGPSIFTNFLNIPEALSPDRLTALLSDAKSNRDENKLAALGLFLKTRGDQTNAFRVLGHGRVCFQGLYLPSQRRLGNIPLAVWRKARKLSLVVTSPG